MPISQSAKKALRVNLRQTEVNRRRKQAVKSALKTVTAETVNKTVSMIDKATKWGIFEKNKAARLKSRLAKQFGATPAAETKATKPASTAKATKPTKKTATKKPAAKK